MPDYIYFFDTHLHYTFACKGCEVKTSKPYYYMRSGLFTPEITVAHINKMSEGSMSGFLGIEVTEIGTDYIRGKMPVNERTKQPLGLLHGGASLVLAESLGSLAATFSVDRKKQYCVGLEINANHVKSVKDGFVFGITRPLHLGKKTQVWEIKITNEADQLTCISRITMAILDIRK